MRDGKVSFCHVEVTLAKSSNLRMGADWLEVRIYTHLSHRTPSLGRQEGLISHALCQEAFIENPKVWTLRALGSGEHNRADPPGSEVELM